MQTRVRIHITLNAQPTQRQREGSHRVACRRTHEVRAYAQAHAYVYAYAYALVRITSVAWHWHSHARICIVKQHTRVRACMHACVHMGMDSCADACMPAVSMCTCALASQTYARPPISMHACMHACIPPPPTCTRARAYAPALTPYTHT